MSSSRNSPAPPSRWTAENPQFTLYTHRIGPNGWKAATVLSALNLTYRSIYLNFGADMKAPEYLALCPNGRIPALIDHSAGDLAIWESAAIILYLVKKYDTTYSLWSPSIDEQAQIEIWLMFQISGQGPYLGQAMWFFHYHEEEIESAKLRYLDESRRVLSVVEGQLSREGSGGWLVLQRCTVADLAFLTWWLHARRIGIKIADEFPAVHAWMGRLEAIESVRRGLEGCVVPEGGTLRR